MQLFGKNKKGFTIVELVVVIAVIGILAGIVIVGYGEWKKSTAISATKSDLSALNTTMENGRNFSNGYPTSIPASAATSQNTTFTYVDGSTGWYCIEGRSKAVGGLTYHIDTTTSSNVEDGPCPFRAAN